jgi:hypothetical protein
MVTLAQVLIASWVMDTLWSAHASKWVIYSLTARCPEPEEWT